jgi:hypothetical protein
MRTRYWIPAVLGPAAMLAVAGDDKQVSLTIYDKNIALIEHVRPIRAPAGRSASSSRECPRRSCPRR